MADVNINIFTNKVYKQGASTVVPGFIEGEEPTPINPSGSGGASEFVPYVGATENFDLGEFGLSAGFLKLDTTPTNTPTDQGTMYWDEDDNTVDIILNGYIMKVGEDLFYPVKNQTGSSIPKGTNVGFAGTLGMSGRLLITPYLANGANPTSRYMGVTAETIADGDDGKVLWFGRIRGINTNAFNEGDILYASTSSAGAFQTTLPVAPNNIVEVAAVVTKSTNNGVIFVRPQFLVTPDGSNTQIQYNNSGAFGASSDFTFNNTSKKLQIGNLTSLSTNTPVELNQGGTYADTVVASKAKWKFYDDGIPANIYGIGISFEQFNFFKATGGGYYWYFNNIQAMRLTPTVFSLPVNELLGFAGSSSVTTSNYAISGNTTDTFINGPGISGKISFRINNSNIAQIDSNSLIIVDSKNIELGTTTGTKIGTATSQKLAFWNATPIVQPTTGIAESAFVENSGGVNVNDDSTFDGYTLRQVVKALRDAGLLA